jgi:hypothetical protein
MVRCWLDAEMLIGLYNSGNRESFGATEMWILISSHLHAHFIAFSYFDLHSKGNIGASRFGRSRKKARDHGTGRARLTRS